MDGKGDDEEGSVRSIVVAGKAMSEQRKKSKSYLMNEATNVHFIHIHE